MTVALYARRKDWPLQDLTVPLRHSRVHAWIALNAKQRKATSIASTGSSVSRET